MGRLIMCVNPPAKRPYRIGPEACPVYTLEELCYYIEQRFYLIDKKTINRELVLWLKKEAGYPALAAKLEKSLYKYQSPCPAAMLLFQESGLYTAGELRKMERLLAQMKGKTALECRKIKADGYLETEQYAAAIREYDALLKKENQGRMTDALRGAIRHNKGVAYARLFLFEEAAECFLLAWQDAGREESLQACIFALNYTDSSVQEAFGQHLHLTLEMMQKASEQFRLLSRNPSNLKERKAAGAILDSAGHVSAQKRTALLEEWKQDYLEMTK